MNRPTMEELRIAGVEARLEPIRQQVDELRAAVRRRLLIMGTAALVVARRAARDNAGTTP